MSDLQLKGIVLREEDMGESDKLITLLTESHGKVRVSCKGVRSLKSKRFSSAQLFAYSDFVLSEKNGRYYLKECELIESFFGLRESPDSLYLASYFAEVTSFVTVEGESEPDILSLLLNSLYLLSEKRKPAKTVKPVFEMRLCSLLGFTPDLSVCSCCGKKKEDVLLDIVGGTLVCNDCFFEGKSAGEIDGPVFPLTPGVGSALRFILTAPSKKIFAFTLSDEDMTDLARVTESYLLARTEKNFVTLDFYKSVSGF